MAAKFPLVCCMLADLRPHRHTERASPTSPAREVTPAVIRHRRSKTSVKAPRGNRSPSVRPQTPVTGQHQSPVGRQKSKSSAKTTRTHESASGPARTPANNRHESAKLHPPVGTDTEHSGDAAVPRSKSRRVAAFVKRKLSRTKSTARINDFDDTEESNEAKRNNRRSLLSEVHGYDPDAQLLDDIEDGGPVKCDESGVHSPTGGKKTTRSEKRRSTLPSRHSESLAEPRAARRSQSLYSLVSIPRICTFNDIRLPSFSAVLTSKTWRQSLMDELDINPPTPQPPPAKPSPLPRSSTDKQVEELIKSATPTLPGNHREFLNPQSRFTAAVEALHNQPERPVAIGQAVTADIAYGAEGDPAHPPKILRVEQQSPICTARDPTTTKNAEPGEPPKPMGRPDQRNQSPESNDPGQKSTDSTVHLQNMHISRHLRSESNTTTRAPTRINTRVNSSVSYPILNESSTVNNAEEGAGQERIGSANKSGSRGDELPANLGKPIQDDASSTYSEKTCPRRVNGQGSSPSDIADLAKTTAARLDVETPCDELERKEPSTALAKEVHDSVTELQIFPFPPASTALLQFVVEDEINTYASLQEEPLTSDNHSTSTLGKESRFKEELDMQNTKTTSKRRSLLGLFRSGKKEGKNEEGDPSPVDQSYDGTSEGPQRLKRAAPLERSSGATGLMAAAIKQNVNEKSALFLGPNKEQADQPSIRERSASVARPASAPGARASAVGDALPLPMTVPHQRSKSPFLTPSFAKVDFSGGLAGEGPSNRKQSVMMGPYSEIRELERKKSATPLFQLNDEPAELETESDPISEQEIAEFHEPGNTDFGPWARYPSHSRHERSGSAGKSDDMIVRDFAPELEPLDDRKSTDISIDTGSDGRKSLRQRLRGSRGKSQRAGLQKSRSMIFAKDVIKNYARHILAPNTDFLKHGHGHRTSISTGGALEHPEFEVLPPVFAAAPRISNDFGLEAIELDTLTSPDASDAKKQHHQTTVTVSRFDGAVDSPSLSLANGVKRQASEPLVGTSPRAANPVRSRSSSNPFWSNRYASCVFMPRVSFDEVKVEDTTGDEVLGTTSIDSTLPLLADEVLDRSPSCTTHHSLPDKLDKSYAPAASSLQSDHIRKVSQSSNYSQSNIAMTPGLLLPKHAKKGSGSSSLRKSSANLLAMLKETEERERQKLMGVIGGTGTTTEARDLSDISLLVGPPSLANLQKT